MQKVIPPGLNYGDIKPEAIENQIRIVKFTPIATIQSAQANDVVRFHLQGNGFYDPYSAYIRIRVEVPDIADPAEPDALGRLPLSGRFLDRSAHSLFSRLVIRSQGTELERIEQYDVMAAMINDMIYSQEQRLLHHYEGFGCKSVNLANAPDIGPTGVGASEAYGLSLLPLILPDAGNIHSTRMGDYGVWKLRTGPDGSYNDNLRGLWIGGIQSALNVPHASIRIKTKDAYENKADGGVGYRRYDNIPVGDINNIGDDGSIETGFIGYVIKDRAAASFKSIGSIGGSIANSYPLGLSLSGIPVTFGEAFGLVDDIANPLADKVNNIQGGLFGVANGGHNLNNGGRVTLKSATELEFCIPIYSGIIGVLMPTKKLIPMSLLPLEIEFTMNPHAFYPVGTDTKRNYVVKRFEIWTHTMFFEQELHRSLEAAVAESGVFIHYNSFYLAPVNTYNGAAGAAVPQYNQIGVFLKSINALHWAFLYNSYEQIDGPRKLHFVSHNISSLQVRNGMDLMPSEPIIARTGGDTLRGTQPINYHSPYLIELYKAWNKMHDPLADSALDSLNYNVDHALEKPTTMAQFMKNMTTLGTCQYGVSLEGDELGMNKSMIAGKKSVMPFDINLSGFKSAAAVSYMMCFLRADFIIYVRPDLVVTRLGL